TGVPVLAMESPRGFNDPWLHMASLVMGRAELLLLLGKKPGFVVRFAQPPAFAADCRVVQVDADAASLRAGALGIVADPAAGADQLSRAPPAWGEGGRAARAPVPAEWPAGRQSARAPIHPLRVAAALQRHVDRGAILVAAGGEVAQWMRGGAE